MDQDAEQIMAYNMIDTIRNLMKPIVNTVLVPNYKDWLGLSSQINSYNVVPPSYVWWFLFLHWPQMHQKK
jgi:hypothetical protein